MKQGGAADGRIPKRPHPIIRRTASPRSFIPLDGTRFRRSRSVDRSHGGVFPHARQAFSPRDRHPQLRLLLTARIIDVENKARASRVIMSSAQQGSQLTVSRAEADAPQEDRRHALARQIERLDAEMDAFCTWAAGTGERSPRDARAGYGLTDEETANVGAGTTDWDQGWHGWENPGVRNHPGRSQTGGVRRDGVEIAAVKTLQNGGHDDATLSLSVVRTVRLDGGVL